jgi:hypothetical protein
MLVRFMMAAMLLAFATSTGSAQTAGGFSILGVVTQVDAAALVVRSDADGTVQRFALAPNVLVLQNRAITLADIKPQDFIASAAVPGVDGKLHSTELRIFPEALRGVGEGQRPMADPRNQTMTNATVTGAAVVDGANRLKVSFRGGESELVVDPGIPVTRIDVADRALVVAGAKLRVQGTRGSDGATVSRITLQ